MTAGPAVEWRSCSLSSRPRSGLNDGDRQLHDRTYKNDLLNIRIVIVATPRRAQTTKMERPAGVLGERSPQKCGPRLYRLNAVQGITYHIRLW